MDACGKRQYSQRKRARLRILASVRLSMANYAAERRGRGRCRRARFALDFRIERKLLAKTNASSSAVSSGVSVPSLHLSASFEYRACCFDEKRSDAMYR